MNAKDTAPVTKDMPNPANSPTAAGEERIRRVPMSVPTRKLEVDPIAGFHLHWFGENKAERAKQAGYELVRPEEVRLNSTRLGRDRSEGGNTDLGSCVSIVGSIEGANGHERLVLMKLKEEWWQEDKAALDEKNAAIMRDIFVGERIEAVKGGGEGTYVKTAKMNSPIINRGMPKAKIAQGGRS